MKTKLMLAAAMLTALPALAQAQGGGRGMMRADANGDGMISRAEAKAQSDSRFATMDANHDGVLTGDELTGPRGNAAGDGTTTRADYDARAEKRFARMDANGDGMLTADELRAVMERMRAGRTDPADAVAPPPAPAPGQ